MLLFKGGVLIYAEHCIYMGLTTIYFGGDVDLLFPIYFQCRINKANKTV